MTSRAAELWLQGCDDGDFLPLRDYAEKLEAQKFDLEGRLEAAMYDLQDRDRSGVALREKQRERIAELETLLGIQGG